MSMPGYTNSDYRRDMVVFMMNHYAQTYRVIDPYVHNDMILTAEYVGPNVPPIMVLIKFCTGAPDKDDLINLVAHGNSYPFPVYKRWCFITPPHEPRWHLEARIRDVAIITQDGFKPVLYFDH